MYTLYMHAIHSTLQDSSPIARRRPLLASMGIQLWRRLLLGEGDGDAAVDSESDSPRGMLIIPLYKADVWILMLSTLYKPCSQAVEAHNSCLIAPTVRLIGV
jgi:hypothetical protein